MTNIFDHPTRNNYILASQEVAKFLKHKLYPSKKIEDDYKLALSNYSDYLDSIGVPKFKCLMTPPKKK